MEDIKYKNLTKFEIRKVFDKLTSYGLDLLEDVIEAWQYDHEEDGKILKKAYIEALEVKEHDKMNERDEKYHEVIKLRNSLINLDDKELKFLSDLLELDPSEVFDDSLYTDYNNCEEDFDCERFGVSPYKEICEHVTDEIEKRKRTNPLVAPNKNTTRLFAKRYNKSMVLKNKEISISPYSF